MIALELDAEQKRLAKIVGALTLLALLLRVYRLTFGSIWLDEGYTVFLSALPAGELLSAWPCDDNPFLSSRIYSAWAFIFGRSETAYESLSVLFAVLTVPATAMLGWMLCGARAAAWAAFLLSVSALHVRYSQFIRVYSAAVFFVVLAALFLTSFLQSGRRRDALSWAAAAALAVHLHYLGALLIGAIVCGSLPLAASRARTRGLVLSCAAVMLLSAPALYQLATHYLGGALTTGWVKSGALETFLSIWYHLSSESSLLLVILFSAVIFAAIGAVRERRSRDSAVLLVSWLLLPMAAVWLASSLGSQFFHVRYFVFVLPAFVLLAGWGLSRLGPNVDLIWLLPLVIVLSGNSLSEYYFEVLQSARERAAYEFLRDNYRSGDVVVHTSKCSYVPALFYASAPREEYLLESAPHSRTLSCVGADERRIAMADVGGYNRLWLFNRDCYPRRASEKVFQSAEFKDLYPRLLYESPDGSLSLFDLTYKEIYARTEPGRNEEGGLCPWSREKEVAAQL